MELTSEEFMREIVSHSFFETATRIFCEFVERGDRVKYSKELMGQDEMNQLLNTALHIVEDTHMRLQEEKCNRCRQTPRIQNDRLHRMESTWACGPALAFLLLVIPFLIWIRLKGKIDNSALRFSTLDIISGQFRQKQIQTWFPQLLRYSSLAFLILAISRPQYDRSTETVLSSGVDIVLAIDLSASMLALDMSESNGRERTRLERGQGSDR